MSRTDFLRKDPLAGDVATEHRGRKGRLPVGDYDRSLLGSGAVHSTVSDMATHTEALLRAGWAERTDPAAADAHADVVAPVQSGSQDPGDRAGIFLHDFDGGRVVGHNGNLPGFAFALLLPDGQVGVVVLTNTATLFGAHLLAEASLRSGLGLPPAGSRLPRPDVPERPDIGGPGLSHERPLAEAATGRQAHPLERRSKELPAECRRYVTRRQWLSHDYVYRRAEDLLPEYRTTWLNRPHGGPSGSGFIVFVVPGLAAVMWILLTLRLEQGTAACGRGDDHLGDYLLARDCADRALTKIIVAIVLDTSAPPEQLRPSCGRAGPARRLSRSSAHPAGRSPGSPRSVAKSAAEAELHALGRCVSPKSHTAAAGARRLDTPGLLGAVLGATPGHRPARARW